MESRGTPVIKGLMRLANIHPLCRDYERLRSLFRQPVTAGAIAAATTAG